MPILNPTVNTVLDFESLETDFPIMLPGGRLTLSASDPTGDGSNVTQLFYRPFTHSFVPAFNRFTGKWNCLRIPDGGVTVNVAVTAGAHADIYAQGGSDQILSARTQGWSSLSGRFRPLIVNGVRVLDFDGNPDPNYQTYLGSIRTSGTGSDARLNDNSQFRHVWNAYNQVEKPVQALEAANQWQTNTTVYRNLNNNANNRIELLSGIAGQKIDIEGRYSGFVTSGQAVYFAITNNGVFDGSNQVALQTANLGETSVQNRLITRSVLGLNTIRPLELTNGSGQPIIYGYGRSGLRGFWLC